MDETLKKVLAKLQIHKKPSKLQQYNRLCYIIDLWIKRYNPCNVKIVEGKVTCADYPNGRKGNTLCCGKSKHKNQPRKLFQKTCKFHSSTSGCITQNLGCKVSFCDAAFENIIEMSKTTYIVPLLSVINTINQTIKNDNIPCKPRYSKEQLFKTKRK